MNTKRFLSVILALCLVLALAPAALATDVEISIEAGGDINGSITINAGATEGCNSDVNIGANPGTPGKPGAPGCYDDVPGCIEPDNYCGDPCDPCRPGRFRDRFCEWTKAQKLKQAASRSAARDALEKVKYGLTLPENPGWILTKSSIHGPTDNGYVLLYFKNTATGEKYSCIVNCYIPSHGGDEVPERYTQFTQGRVWIVDECGHKIKGDRFAHYPSDWLITPFETYDENDVYDSFFTQLFAGQLHGSIKYKYITK